MKKLTIRGVPASLKDDGWWLDGPVIEAVHFGKPRIVLGKPKGDAA